MNIDCHCDLGKGDRMTAPWNADAPMASHTNYAQGYE
jgi:hypothetical protein